jgi:hypothetical protein
MAVAGGYLDQPRRWQRLMRLMEDRASRIEAAYKKLNADLPDGAGFG